MKQGRYSMLSRTLNVLRDLMEGREHDRNSVARKSEVRLAGADREIKALLSYVPGVLAERRGRRRVIKFDHSQLLSPPDFPTAIAACLGASLAPLFDGSGYDVEMRKALGYVIQRARRRDEFKDIERKFTFVRQGGEVSLPSNAGDLHDLIDGILRQKEVTFGYEHFTGPPENVTTRPLTLAIYQHQLYVLGQSRAGQIHPYRFARITNVDLSDSTFEYPSRVEYDPKTLFRDSMGIFVGENYSVERLKVRLVPRWAKYVKSHRWHESQTVQFDDTGGVVITLQVRVCPELERWVLGFGEDAEVLEPASLRSKMASRIESMRSNYQ